MWYWSCGGHAATNTACLVLIWRHAPVWAGTRRDSSPVKTREVFKKREMEKSHNPILSLKCFCCTLILYRPRRESCVRSIKTQAASLQSSLPLNQVGFSSNEAEYYFSLKRTSLWEKKGKSDSNYHQILAGIISTATWFPAVLTRGRRDYVATAQTN